MMAPTHIAFGLFSTSLSLISLPMPWVGAQLWEAFTPITPFVIPLVALVAQLPIIWIKFKVPKEEMAEAGEFAITATEVGSDMQAVAGK